LFYSGLSCAPKFVSIGDLIQKLKLEEIVTTRTHINTHTNTGSAVTFQAYLSLF